MSEEGLLRRDRDGSNHLEGLTGMPTPHAARDLDLPVDFPSGIVASTTRAGIRSGPGEDLALLVAPEAATGAAVFTRNRFAAAPIECSRRHLAASGGKVRALLINAGCANAATGDRGRRDADASVAEVARTIATSSERVLVNSTGVIGEPLPITAMLEALPRLGRGLRKDRVEAVARAIMTTDTAPKAVEREIRSAEGGRLRIVGIAKGSGMIHPNMATMIGVVTTDAEIPAERLQTHLKKTVDGTFNRVSVDGDTSTNDAVFALASGTAGPPADDEDFGRALQEVCLDLARMIVADGEGASRTLEVEVVGAASPEDAHEVAVTVGSSLLVRTAVAGGDANWGRIIAALGRTSATFDPDRISLHVGGVELFGHGRPTHHEAEAAFRSDAVRMIVDLAAGDCRDRHLTCDLTADYVHINADYRT